MKLMKRVIAAALAVSMTVSLSACGGGSAPADETTKAAEQKQETEAAQGETKADQAAGGEEVTLRFSWWGGDSRHEATQKAVDAFMAKYPNIKV